MTRNRATAKQAGTAWETAIVNALQFAGWENAERRRLSGALDRGDIAGVAGVCIEAKNTARLDLAGALDEANKEATNAGARLGVAWIKRRGKTSALNGYVVMDGATFIELLIDGGYQ